MSQFPAEQLRFDAAVGLTHLARLHDSPSVRKALARARAVADRDADHPQRRFWNPSAGTAPRPLEAKMNLNRAIDEALWCDVYGLRPQMLAHINGPMRDAGGYGSTHALWALIIARDRKCLDDFPKASAEIRAELRRAQPDAPGSSTLDVDLYAERLLMLQLAHDDHGVTVWAEQLRSRQNADGSWGSADDVEPYHRYHATLAAAWALSTLNQGQDPAHDPAHEHESRSR